MAGNIKHGGFESKPYGKGRRKYTIRNFEPRYSRRGRSHSRDNSGSMLAKMGICTLLAGIVLLSEYMGKMTSLQEVSSGINEDTENIGGDYLGKLRFVELPGIIQVFSSGTKLKMGTEYEDYWLNEDKTCMTVTGMKSTALPSPADGVVKTLSSYNGKTVIELATDGDVTIRCTAAADGAVEEGQPIRKGDTLFSSVEYVEIEVFSAGRPVNPEDYYNMNNGELQ